MNNWRFLAATASMALALSCGQSAGTGSGTPGDLGGGNGANSGDNGNGSSGGTGGSSGNAGSSSGGSPSSGAGGSSSGGGAPSSGSSQASTGSAASGGSAADGGGGVVVDAANTVTIKMDTFTVPAQSEIFMCQDYDNPFGGQDVAIGRSESDMTVGSHHLHVFYGEDSPASHTVVQCQNPFEFRSLLHAAGQPTFVQTYPAGMAAKLKGTLGLRLQAHYVNTSAAPITANVVVKLTKVDPSTVTKWVAELYFNRTVLTVPTGDGQQVSTTCTVPADYGPIGLIGGGSHMHKRGVHFVAKTSTGVNLIDTTQWEDPPVATYDPPILMNPGDSINWTCTYDNDTGAPLQFGDSAQKNEMCIYLARFYSAPSGDDIECQSPSPSGAGAVTNNVPQ